MGYMGQRIGWYIWDKGQVGINDKKTNIGVTERMGGGDKQLRT